MCTLPDYFGSYYGWPAAHKVPMGLMGGDVKIQQPIVLGCLGPYLGWALLEDVSLGLY